MNQDELLPYILDRLNVGVFVVDRDRRVTYWNRFMAVNSGRPSNEVLGRLLFECFPDLPRTWFERQCGIVTLLKQNAFSGWEQRPFLFEFNNTQPVTADVATMRQDCTFLPIKEADGRVQSICVVVTDVTETSVYRTGLQAALSELEEISIRDGLGWPCAICWSTPCATPSTTASSRPRSETPRASPPSPSSSCPIVRTGTCWSWW